MLKHIMTATLWSTLIALVVCYFTSTHAFVVPLKCSLSLPTPISSNRRALSSSTTNTRNLLPSRGFVSALFSEKQNSQEKEASSETSSSPSSKAEDCGCDEQKPGLPPPLTPFMEALDPKYKCTGPVGQGSFVVSRTGGPTKEELSNENLYKILMIECSDLEVNTVVWKCLGYRFDEEKQEWTAAEVFPNWREKYPTPPDLIGMARIYSKEVDQPSLKANQSLVRSVPVDNKQSLKTHLKPLGFTGYKVCVNGVWYMIDCVHICIILLLYIEKVWFVDKNGTVLLHGLDD